MKSPFTGGKVIKQVRSAILTFRGESIEIMYHNFRCEDTGQEFTTTRADEMNMSQLCNRYREKYRNPFQNEIK